MPRSLSISKLLATVGVAVVLTLFLASSAAYAEDDTIGSDEYRISCMSCHGVGGRGDGPLAKFLTVKPTDLTSLSVNNGGQYPNLKAGQYPFLRVYQIIDGRAAVEVHGERAMPVWGNRYLSEQPVGKSSYGGEYEKMVRGRILELVYYIQSIQQ
jgi:mono/diheme cytochrome c family protein